MANGVIEVSQLDILSQSGTGITTVVPPATNTNRTLTLPDETGTVLVNGTTSNVGIGTSSPANKLEVSGAIVAQGAATAYTNTGLYLQNKGSSVFDVGAWRSGASVAELTFSTDSGSDAAPVERMRIDSSGNVGIGTSNPTTRLQIGAASNTTTDYPLTINNSANNYGVQVGAYGMSNRIYGASTINYDFDIGGVAIFKTNNAERMRITSTGNVGIGTSSPSQKLQVAGVVQADAGVVLGDTNKHYIYNGGVGQIGIRFNDGATALGYMWLKDFGGSTRGMGVTSGRLAFATDSTERMRIDENGNVGIGTSSPLGKLKVVVGDNAPAASGNMNTGVIYESGFGARAINFGVNNTAGYSWINAAFSNNSSVADNLVLMTGTTERMRIDTTGNLLVGTTTKPTIGGIGAGFQPGVSVAGNTTLTFRTNTTGNYEPMFFYNPNGLVGFIRTSASATSYATSSDYRLKEDWQPMSGSVDRVKALKPVNFAWKLDGSRVDGFLAHEAQAVVPEAVTGTKDAVDAEGKPDYQGIDQSKLVPLLTAALQEALAAIESLTARVTALENA